jgi:hypothetical protein
LARNSGGYSRPITGTPCDVPEPKKIKENDMRGNVKGKMPNAK